MILFNQNLTHEDKEHFLGRLKEAEKSVSHATSPKKNSKLHSNLARIIDELHVKVQEKSIISSKYASDPGSDSSADL